MKVIFPLIPRVVGSEPCVTLREDLLLYLALCYLTDLDPSGFGGEQLVCRFYYTIGSRAARVYLNEHLQNTLTSCEEIERCQSLQRQTGLRWVRFSYAEGTGYEAVFEEGDRLRLPVEVSDILRWITSPRAKGWDLWRSTTTPAPKPAPDLVQITDSEVEIRYKNCPRVALDTGVKRVRGSASIPLGRITVEHANMFEGEHDVARFRFRREDLEQAL